MTGWSPNPSACALRGRDLGLCDGIDPGMENQLCRIVSPERSVHHPFQLAIVFGERLKLFDGFAQAGTVSNA